jgi:hypothetical protein
VALRITFPIKFTLSAETWSPASTKGKRDRGGRIPKEIEDSEICSWWTAGYRRRREGGRIFLDFPNSNSKSMKDLLSDEIIAKRFSRFPSQQIENDSNRSRLSPKFGI